MWIGLHFSVARPQWHSQISKLDNLLYNSWVELPNTDVFEHFLAYQCFELMGYIVSNRFSIHVFT